MVVWGRDQYITEAMRQLENREYSEHLLSNPIEQMKTELVEKLLQNEEWISQKEHDFLFCNSPRIPSFYMQVCKNLENPPGRPVISGNESVTEPASQFVDFSIK